MVHIIYSYTFNVFLSYHSLFLTSHFPSPNFHLFFHSLHIPLVSPLLPLHSTLPTIFPIVSSIPLGLLSRSCGHVSLTCLLSGVTENKAKVLVQFNSSMSINLSNKIHWFFSTFFMVFENMKSKHPAQTTPLVLGYDC